MKDEKKAPKLRFKSFTDDWEQVKYGEIFQQRSKMGVSTPALPSVEYDDINPGMGTLNKEPKSKGTSKRGIHFNPGDVLFGKLRPYLKNWLFACFEGVAVGDFWVLTSSKIDHGFTYSLIQAPGFQYIANLSSGSKMPRSDWGLVSNARTFIPTTLSEQESISSVLFGLDTTITLHEGKKRQLELLKSALLQKMFADENGYPSVRFREFSDVWQLKKFKEVYAKSKEKNTRYGIQDIISVANMHYNKNASIRSVEYLKTYNVFKIGDIAFEGNKSSRFSHGRFVENTIGDGIVSHVFDVFRPIDKHDLQFMKHYINCENVMGPIMLRVTKASTMMTNLVAKDFLNESIRIPSISEQQHIGRLLECLNQLITMHQNKLNNLKILKNSLLQNMFI